MYYTLPRYPLDSERSALSSCSRGAYGGDGPEVALEGAHSRGAARLQPEGHHHRASSGITAFWCSGDPHVVSC
jgi:hypothetical protein